jgi:hypothetical protein
MFRYSRAILALVFALLSSVSLAGAQVESTPIPPAPKPDFSKMQFLVGTWDCSTMSARRPGPYKSTVTTTIEPNGYWMSNKTVIHKASWIPAEFSGEDRMTYDASTSRWIDISTDETGGYDITTSPGWNGNAIVWTELTYTKGNNTATENETTVTKNSDTKTTATSSFTEPGGRLVKVTTVCNKTS